MILSENFSLDELTKSQEAIRLGIDNTPDDEQVGNLILLCKNIQKVKKQKNCCKNLRFVLVICIR